MIILVLKLLVKLMKNKLSSNLYILNLFIYYRENEGKEVKNILKWLKF